MNRHYVVSDIHGYREDFAVALREAGLVDGDDRWSGGDSELWVLGDLMDRGPDGIGALDLAMTLESAAPDQVHVLLGNHEVLALGMYLFPGSAFGHLWKINGGRTRDQDALTPAHVDWLKSRSVAALVGDSLLVHTDTTEYRTWGAGLDGVNAAVRTVLDSGDVDEYLDLFGQLTGRHAFLGKTGPDAARTLLGALGGERVVHGHSIIGDLFDRPSAEVTGPESYADGQVLAIDGGRYDGGPLLVVPLD